MAAAKNKYTVQQFIDIISDYVMLESTLSHILPSVTLAQAIIESKYGNSAPGNNLFGIKGAYNGSYQLLKTKEYDKASKKYIEVYAKFRKYPTWFDSIADHSWLLVKASRYKKIIRCETYEDACQFLQDAGYATSPTYAKTLIDTIKKYKLYEYDTKRSQLYGKL